MADNTVKEATDARLLQFLDNPEVSHGNLRIVVHELLSRLVSRVDSLEERLEQPDWRERR